MCSGVRDCGLSKELNRQNSIAINICSYMSTKLFRFWENSLAISASTPYLEVNEIWFAALTTLKIYI